MTDRRQQVSETLLRMRTDAERSEPERLFLLLSDELRDIAARMLAGERDDHTLQPTALVNEAYLRLVDGASISVRDRIHFLTIAAQAMRHVLIDHARRRAAEKRGGGWKRVLLTDEIGAAAFPDTDVFDLSMALSRLERDDPQLSQVVELRVFAGLTMQEIADLTGRTRRTVHNYWRAAVMFLRRSMSQDAV